MIIPISCHKKQICSCLAAVIVGSTWAAGSGIRGLVLGQCQGQLTGQAISLNGESFRSPHLCGYMSNAGG